MQRTIWSLGRLVEREVRVWAEPWWPVWSVIWDEVKCPVVVVSRWEDSERVRKEGMYIIRGEVERMRVL